MTILEATGFAVEITFSTSMALVAFSAGFKTAALLGFIVSPP